MRLTLHTDFSLRVLMQVGLNDGKLATIKDIAQSFSLSVQTVKHHLTSIFDKMGVSNRLELALFAVNHHLSTEDQPRQSVQSAATISH